ncbi:glycosyltransferase family 9 protein [Nisaea sp.]|uniref:glycosyltransferase family 9 protein n=1 Tax=Nisaea sp. TaxID=2024842 RepID=UPI003B52B14E
MGSLLRRDHDIRPKGDIVVLKMLGGGSLVLAYPALLGLKTSYPDRKLRLVCTGATRPFAELLGIFDEIHSVDDGGSLLKLMGSSFTALRAVSHCDTIIDLEVYSRLSTIFCLLTMARNRLCFYLDTAYWRKGLATHLFYFNRSGSAPLHYAQIARALGAEVPDTEACRDSFLAANGLAPHSQTGDGRERLGLACFCSDLALERMFSAREWGELLAREMKGRDLSITLFGGPGDRDAAEEMAAAIRTALPSATVENACGRCSLKETAARIAKMDRFWSIDTGLLHIARQIGVPTTSFWGPTAPHTLLQDLPGTDEAVHYSALPCSPCVHVHDEPPCGGTRPCMVAHLRELTPEERNPAWVESS